MGGRWIEAEPRLKKRESLFGVQRGMFRGAVGLVNLVLRCNVRNNESAAVALRIRIANLKSGQHPGAKPITKKRALPSTFLLLGRAWGTFWGAATPAQEGEVMQTALTMVLGKHHLKVSRRCSDKAEFHILQHLHFYNSPNSKYLFEDNMEKINQEQVPAKVIKGGARQDVDKIDSGSMLAPFVYDCTNWSDRLVQLQNDPLQPQSSREKYSKTGRKL
ncbi:hypothetical protein BKA59DRAFT_454186 [Fusarium tricinctum]|uniref:Uncharacterized protein n=1 Tax=Fusarium tricinctum TaxID=61284 RepID=A0A8K0RZV8_9HYPO|nr:hypothetical protein BKA59DRAFT_454186 [Fusarium tricinctum]